MMDLFRRFFPKPPDGVLLRDSARVDQGAIYDGTVGWDDGEDHFDIDTDSGVTLVKVTLFKGHNPPTDGEKTTDRARGTQVLCRIGAPLYSIPPDGAQVIVAMPADRMLVPGGGVIITQVIASPATQFGSSRANMNFGPDVDVVIKARSITLTDYEDRYLTLGPKYGFKLGDADANGCQLKDAQWLFYTVNGDNAATTFRLSRADGIALLIDDGQTVALTMGGGKFVGCGETFAAQFAVGYLGKLPSVASGIAYSPAGPANVVSTSWFVSPV